MDKLIGAVKVMLDGYTEDRFDSPADLLHAFINTMKQEPVMEQLLPLSRRAARAHRKARGTTSTSPRRKTVLDQVLTRYIEAIIYQAVAENMASEQSARMVAMKAASRQRRQRDRRADAGLQQDRQAAITKELSEIVGGAAAV